MYERIVCIDFDGVLHSYKNGWEGIDIISDDPVDGAIDWLRHLINHKGLTPYIFSTRSNEPRGVKAMREWLIKYGLTENELKGLKFSASKPSAWITIDDRAIRFNGVFPTDDEIMNFKPWYMK
jgi:hypothetical protein